MKQLLSLRASSFKFLDHELLCDFSTGAPRPLLPLLFRYPAFAAAHTLSHPGIQATKRLMSARWVWAGMAADIARWCCDCQHCQWAKVTKQPRAAVQHIPIPTRRFSHDHIDLFGPLPRSSDGFNHIFTMVDRSSRWLEAIPLSSTDTASIAAAFTSSWVARFGVPDHLTSDRGPQFCLATSGRSCRSSGGASSITSPLHIIHKPTGWSREPTASSRTPCGSAPLAATGHLTSPGFSLACGWPPKRIPTCFQRSWCTGHP